jgi:exopolysaccharide biosynthesis polyprenyl glycosylphosphotransferase
MRPNNAAPPSEQSDAPPAQPVLTRPMARPSVRDRGSLQLALFMQIASVIGDVASIVGAFWLAYQLRYRLELGGEVSPAAWASFTTFAPPAVAGSVLALVIFPMRGMYQIRRKQSLVDDVPRLVGGLSLVVAGVILLAFFFRFTPSRLIFLYVWFFGLLFMLTHRTIWAAARHWLWRRGIGIDRVLIVGEGESGRRIMQSMLSNSDLGYRLIGYAGDPAKGDRINVATERGILTCPRLGTAAEVGALVRRHRVDEVVVLANGRGAENATSILEQCRESVVQFRIVPDLLQISLDRVDFSEIGGVPTIGVRDASIRGWNAFLKRTIDIVFSTIVLTATFIPMLIIAVLIKRDSPGPVFYTQTRIGKYGQPFTMIKFRCMVVNADRMWTHMVKSVDGGDHRLFKDPEDPRMTKIGRKLRRFSIDELPQFFNVLRGEMSIIGPRPPIPQEVAAYEDWHLQRLLLQPGLTGLWQVNGRSDLAFDEMVRLDLYYAENWSPWLDTRIMLRTIPAVVLGRGAY